MRNLIPPFVRPMMRLVGTNDRGAVGVLVGILLSTGVLLGMAALTVDVGMIYQERAELQNGADAGSIAVAKTCVVGTTGCRPGDAANYANLNSKDGVSDVTTVCGHGDGLTPCPTVPEPPRMVDCPTLPEDDDDPTNDDANYVDVHTATKTTETTGDSTLLPPVFSRALAGNAGYEGDTVLACARAMWGPAMPGSKSLAMTLSQCAWTAATGGGTTFDVDFRFFVRDPSAPTGDCQSAPGAFGWLGQDESGECTADIDLTENTAESDTGKDVPKECKGPLKSYVDNKTLIYIPIFSSTEDTGGNATYNLVGLAAFIITGYANMPGADPRTYPKELKDACPKGDTSPSCIFGHFTKALVPVSTSIGGTDFGAIAIKLAG
jgi:hypothetical protein